MRQILDPVLVEEDASGHGGLEQHHHHCQAGVEAEAAPAADLGGDVAREEDGAVEEAGGHDGAREPEVWEEVVDVELMVARPPGEDGGGVEDGGEGGEGLQEGEELEQEPQAAPPAPAAALLGAAAARHRRWVGGFGFGFGLRGEEEEEAGFGGRRWMIEEEDSWRWTN